MAIDLSPTTKFPSDQDASGRTLGDEEFRLLMDAIESGTLTSTKGRFVKELEASFAAIIGQKAAYACSSGTAAIHTAVAAVDPEPGEEIITSPITDMGAITPILYQGAVPVFADVDPVSLNVTPESIEARLNERTRAIIVTHLFGKPCEMHGIMELARSHNIPVIEDCAQAFLARDQGELVGTLGDIGCFSLQQGKHITTGEGGLVSTNDEALARRMFLFINKGWGYGDPNPDHYFVALNYRMNELSGAVAVAQLGKLEQNVNLRISAADSLSSKLKSLPGLTLPTPKSRDTHAYWRYALIVDEAVIPGGAVALGAKLREMGIACAPRYIQKPAYECAVIRDQRTFGQSRFPFNLARPEAVDYSPEKFAGTLEGLQHVLVLPWNENLAEEHIEFMGNAIRESITSLGTA